MKTSGVRNVGAISISIDVSQIESKFVSILQNAKKTMPEFIDMWVTQMGDTAIDYAIPLTRVDTGRLRSSYRLSDIRHVGKSTAILVYNYASDNGGKYSYAGFNEYGTRFMAPRLMLTTAREAVIQECPDLIKTALIRLLRGDVSGRYTYKLD